MAHPTHNESPRRRRSLLEPALATASPEEILNHPGLTREEKIEVLRSMQYDAAEIAVAEEEGMQGPDDNELQRIRAALVQLGAGDAEAAAPTKQHGLH